RTCALPICPETHPVTTRLRRALRVTHCRPVTSDTPGRTSVCKDRRQRRTSAVATLRPRNRRLVIRIAQHIVCSEGVTIVADMCPAAVDPASPEALRETFSRFPQGVA